MAIALAVTKEKAAGRIYHVAEPETLSEGERVTKIGELAGWKGKVVRTIEWERKHPSTEMQQLAAPFLLDYATEDAVLKG